MREPQIQISNKRQSAFRSLAIEQVPLILGCLLQNRALLHVNSRSRPNSLRSICIGSCSLLADFPRPNARVAGLRMLDAPGPARARA